MECPEISQQSHILYRHLKCAWSACDWKTNKQPSKTELAGQKNARKLKGRDAIPMKQHVAIMKLNRRKILKREMKIHEVSMASTALNDKYSYPRVIKYYA